MDSMGNLTVYELFMPLRKAIRNLALSPYVVMFSFGH